MLTALENSWIHLRRKKRERVRHLRELPRASADFLQAIEESDSSGRDSSVTPKCAGQKAAIAAGTYLTLELTDEGLTNTSAMKEENCTEGSKGTEQEAGTLASSEDSNNTQEESQAFGAEDQTLEIGGTANTSSEWFLFKCVLNVKRGGDDFVIEMHWVEGQNRDLMNQLCTYLKNQIFRLVAT